MAMATNTQLAVMGIAELTVLADSGDAHAQYKLGRRYIESTWQLWYSAVHYLTLAANQNHTAAQCCLGSCYYEGTGVAKDYVQAFKWFMKPAADQGVDIAQYMVGSCYRTGQGVAKNDATALVWYTRAADQKFAPAQYHLGTFHAEGRAGLARDHVVAARHMQLAADQGNAKAEKWLGEVASLRTLFAARRQQAAAQAAIANVPQAAWAGLAAPAHAAIHSQASAVQATSGMVSAATATATTPTRGGGRGGNVPATTPTAYSLSTLKPGNRNRRHQLQGHAATLSPGSAGALTPITFTPLPVGDDTSGTLGTHHKSK